MCGLGYRRGVRARGRVGVFLNVSCVFVCFFQKKCFFDFSYFFFFKKNF